MVSSSRLARPLRARHGLRALLLASSALLAACGGLPCGPGGRAQPVLAEQITLQPYTLLGEVHDNADGHRRRLAVLREAVVAGWRPAIAMEQFDRERQPELDAAMRRCPDADCVIAAASGPGAQWDWQYYRPVIDLALAYKLPLIAANLSRADASRVMRGGLTSVFDAASLRALGLDRGVSAPLLAAQRQAVEASHCGMLPANLVDGMAIAQIARDAVIARRLQQASRAPDGDARQVVLLAGNGHVRRDQGVPRWLGHASSLAVGFIEADAASAGDAPYDRVELLLPSARPDPCASMRPIR